MNPIKEHAPITNIVAIDLETANPYHSSACAVAGVRFDLASGEIAARTYSLINPKEYFDPFYIAIHGITPEMVQDAPLFPEAIRDVYALLDEGSLVVSHNVAFDISALRESYKDAPRDIPDIIFTCTYRLAKQICPGLVSYTLPNVAAAYGVTGLNHHHADSDAEICGKIFLAMLSNYGSIDEMLEAAKLNIGTIRAGEYDGVHRLDAREHTGFHFSERAGKPLPAFTVGPSSPFYEKTVVFTGALSSMPRKNAESIIQQIGGIVGKGVTKNADFLITGYQDPRALNGHEKSAKVMAAEKLLAAGHQIEVIPEEEFLKML